MSNRLEKPIEKVDVETFIERAKQIIERSKSNPTSMVKAQEEACDLFVQFEEYLESKGLEC